MPVLRKALKEASGFFSTIGYCLTLSWKASKFYTLVRMISEVFTPALTIAASFVGKYLIDLMAGNWTVQERTHVLILLFVGLAAITMLRAVSQKVIQYCQSMHEDILDGDIALLLMDRALSADLEYFDNPEYHDKLMAANRDSRAIVYILWSALSSISACVSLVGAFAVLCRANLLYGLVMVTAAVPSSIAAVKYTKLLYHLSLDQLNGERQKNYFQSIAVERAYAQDVRLFHAGPRLKGRYTKLWKDLFGQRKQMTRRRTLLTALLDCLPEVAVILIGIHIAFSVMGGNATVGDYSLYTGLVTQLWAAISNLSFSAMQIYDNQLKIANIKTLEQFQNRVVDAGTRQLRQVETIEFDGVGFTYPGSTTRALDEVSFLLRREEKVALVGLNGSGKSTLIKLLLRMYDPDQGRIRINGVDIREYKLSELRKNFSVYFQDMHNYSFTLKDNLTIADEDRTDADEAAWSALRNSRCDDIIQRADKGLETGVTRLFELDGMELSGGQHQKLALARAFFRHHTALILDEPSSNLDPKAEHDIFQSLQSFTEGKMTIFTSHRLSNVFLADRIIVLERGKVVEDGTQEQLLRNKQRYAELFRYQQEKYQVQDQTSG